MAVGTSPSRHFPGVPSFISFWVWRREGEGCPGRRGQEEMQVWVSRVEGEMISANHIPKARQRARGQPLWTSLAACLSPAAVHQEAPEPCMGRFGFLFLHIYALCLLSEKITACQPPPNTTPSPTPDHLCCCARGDSGEEDKEERG